MRTRPEDEMLALITGFGEEDERIRAMVINGSRANPNAARDPFRDFDVATFVTDVEPFRDEAYVLGRFGEALLVQTPEDKVCPPAVGDGRYNFNVQLADGNRIDLSFFPLSAMAGHVSDSLTRVLLDKDGLLADLPPPSERDYHIQHPTAQRYADACDEFFFGLGSHIPKTYWRRQLPLLKWYIEVVLRRPLLMMLEWEIAAREGDGQTIGRAGRYLQQHLDADTWREWEQTYSGPDYQSTYRSLLAFYRLFRRTAESVAAHYGYSYPAADGERALAFLEHVAGLPQDAQTIY